MQASMGLSYLSQVSSITSHFRNVLHWMVCDLFDLKFVMFVMCISTKLYRQLLTFKNNSAQKVFSVTMIFFYVVPQIIEMILHCQLGIIKPLADIS